MNAITVELAKRNVSASKESSTTAPATKMALADLANGQVAHVVGVTSDADGDGAVARRMYDLGFTPGTTVSVVRRSLLRDPVIYRIGGTEIALRGAQARLIEVEAIR